MVPLGCVHPRMVQVVERNELAMGSLDSFPHLVVSWATSSPNKKLWFSVADVCGVSTVTAGFKVPI